MSGDDQQCMGIGWAGKKDERALTKTAFWMLPVKGMLLVWSRDQLQRASGLRWSGSW
jgi:hypothetical protein